jgi:capsular polysaccharide transport system permease protein
MGPGVCQQGRIVEYGGKSGGAGQRKTIPLQFCSRVDDDSARPDVRLIEQHLRVTAALIAREMSTRYGSKPGGYLWAVFDPVAHVAMMTLIFQALARMPALGLSFPLFFASGYLPFTFYQRMSSFIAGTLKANKALLSYPVVSPFDALVSRFILQLITDALVAVVILMMIVEFGGLTQPMNIAGMIEAAGAAAVLGLGAGAINIVMFARFPIYEQIFGIINRPLFMISGVFFLPENLPNPFRDFILYNPLVHVIMWFRSSVYGEYRADALDWGYVIEFALVCFVAGLMLLTASTREIREDQL